MSVACLHIHSENLRCRVGWGRQQRKLRGFYTLFEKVSWNVFFALCRLFSILCSPQLICCSHGFNRLHGVLPWRQILRGRLVDSYCKSSCTRCGTSARYRSRLEFPSLRATVVRTLCCVVRPLPGLWPCCRVLVTAAISARLLREARGVCAGRG